MCAMRASIPCTVAILTYNSADTLARALESIKTFSEVIVADGGSTDGTQEIVRRFGRTLVAQPTAAQDSSGRLVDYGAARDHIRQFATQPRIMQLDSDEYASEGLLEDVARVVSFQGGPDVYSMQARYEYRGRIVDCASSYPMTFPRLFRASACSGYTGPTHERAIVSGPLGELTSWFVIPYPRVPLMLRKWFRYLQIDRSTLTTQGLQELNRRVAHQKSAIRWFIRNLSSNRRKGCEYPLPLYLEAWRFLFFLARYAVAVERRGARRMLRREGGPAGRR